MSGRGKSQKSLELIDAAVRILEEIQPASVRAVCYRLFTEKLIPSMEKIHTNTVSRHLVYARENDLLDWDFIVDETREAERISSWGDAQDFIRSVMRGYRRDYWRNQPEWIEVWSEKGTVRGTLAPVLEKYGVTFRVMHGHGSATALHSVAEESLYEDDKRMTALYVGDWDPSGMHMSEVDLPDRIERYGGEIDLVRVAIAKQDTTSKARVPHFSVHDKSKDPRYRWFVDRYGAQCFELDALSPVILRKRIEAEILSRLDREAWEHAIKVEAAETESMRSFLTMWPSISMPANKYPDPKP